MKDTIHREEQKHEKQQEMFTEFSIYCLRVIAECVQKSMFNFKYVIGIGGFGKVWKVDHRKNNNQVFAMKEMSKAL